MDIKVVLITGVAGFIGSAVTKHFVKKYPNIMFIGLDKISYCSNIKNLEEISECNNFKFVKGDICEIDFMNFLFKEYSIDGVVHFAAYSHVDHSFGNSLIFTINNVVGTHSLLEASKQNGIKKFIHVSTDEVYGDQDTISDEETILNPTNPYAGTKAAAESIVKSYYHSFKLPVLITRCNNVYGSHQYPEKAIPRFCMRLLKGKKCQIQGSGNQTRSYLYISDVVEAFDLLLFKGIIGEIYNIGCEHEYSIKTIIYDLVKRIYPNDKEEDWCTFVKDRDFNDKRYNINFDKIKKLGWSHKIPFDIGLDLTLNWYRNNMNHWTDEELSRCLECENRTIR